MHLFCITIHERYHTDMTEKQRRHTVLRQVLQEAAVRSQAELQATLQRRDIHVSQATLSRDIKEMGLVKMPMAGAYYRYVIPAEQSQQRQYNQLQLAFQHFVRSYEYSGNLLVVKTTPATAQAVAADIDAMQWPEVLGTIAGDDTILIVTRSLRVVKTLCTHFQQFLSLALDQGGARP